MSNEEQKLTPEELLLKIYENTEKTRKYILMGRILSLIYILMIVVPIILAVVYLPPMLERAFKPYEELFSNSKSQEVMGQLEALKDGGFDLDSLLK